jgi:renalase
MKNKSVAIIGAGMAGLSAASVLSGAGFSVRLFDKGRSPGGRVSTRRVNLANPGGGQTELLFDHGAQFVRTRTPSLSQWLQSEVRAGAARHWSVEGYEDRAAPLFIGAPGMSALPKRLAEPLNLETSAHVTSIRRQKDSWRLEYDQNGVKHISPAFDILIVGAPAPQAAALLAPVNAAARSVADMAAYAPCWAAMFAASAGEFENLQSGPVVGVPAISWISRGRDRHPKKASPDALETIVVHASASWSRANLERSPEEILTLLKASMADSLSACFAPAYEAAHRWRYAIVDRPALRNTVFFEDIGLGLCGDWLLGPTIESAWLSGQALARHVALVRA